MSRVFPELMIWKEVVGAPRFELGTSWSRTKRATRLRYAPIKTVVSGWWLVVSTKTGQGFRKLATNPYPLTTALIGRDGQI